MSTLERRVRQDRSPVASWLSRFSGVGLLVHGGILPERPYRWHPRVESGQCRMTEGELRLAFTSNYPTWPAPTTSPSS